MLKQLTRLFIKNKVHESKIEVEKTHRAELPISDMSDGRIETGSLTWMYVRKWASTERDILRKKNDSIKKDMIQTAYLRGRIKQLTELIDLPEVSAKPRLAPVNSNSKTYAGY